MCSATPYHQPVLLSESLAGLNVHPQGVYVDVTFGGGGHAQAILAQLDGGTLLAFDQDPAAASLAQLIPSKNFVFLPANARFMQQFLTFQGIEAVDGILADLGVSSHQFDTPNRGFSTRLEAPLDMRMNPATPLTAYTVVNTYTPEQLVYLLSSYGEVRYARSLVRAIVAARQQQPIGTTTALLRLITPFAPRGKVWQYAAQVFQALRITVNDELGALQAILEQSTRLLKKDGRLVVISYHSLEDRLVKNLLHKGNITGEVTRDLVYGHLLRPFRPLYKKPITPSAAERQANNRARSAKLRIGVRC